MLGLARTLGALAGSTWAPKSTQVASTVARQAFSIDHVDQRSLDEASSTDLGDQRGSKTASKSDFGRSWIDFGSPGAGF